MPSQGHWHEQAEEEAGAGAKVHHGEAAAARTRTRARGRRRPGACWASSCAAAAIALQAAGHDLEQKAWLLDQEAAEARAAVAKAKADFELAFKVNEQ